MNLLRNKPKFRYNNLTIILSNQSRFDTQRLLSGNAGVLLDNHCLRPETNSMCCDIRLATDDSPLLPNTKCILLLGDVAMIKYLPETINNSLGNIRGGLYEYKGIPTICSFNCQDTVDLKDYESKFNPLSSNYSPDDSVSDDNEEEGDVKSFGTTKRSNYAFWIQRDVWKCKQILSNSPFYTKRQEQVPVYKVYHQAQEVINILTTTKNEILFFDMETDFEEANMQCFSFSFSNSPVVYCVPILNNDYNWAYTSNHFILRALAIAIRDNTLVAHNGSSFDFFVLGFKYRIPIYKVKDTMIMFQRCFPEIEKSLGHMTSYWTWNKFHKDEDSRGYRTHEQMMDRMKYCGKDVWTMKQCYYEMLTYARSVPGLQSSMDMANALIRPYLITTLQGIKVNEEKINEMVIENDKMMMQINRMIELLIGEIGIRLCRARIKGKPSLIAGSNTQCCAYFHDMLGYPAAGVSPKTGKPTLGKKSLYRLALKHNNPVITLICAYRRIAKETSRLRFVPFPSPYYDKGNSEHNTATENSTAQGVQ